MFREVFMHSKMCSNNEKQYRKLCQKPKTIIFAAILKSLLFFPNDTSFLTMNKGTIKQIIGPVVDVSFEAEGSNLPDILNALEIKKI